MTDAMMNNPTNCRPLVRQKRSQNPAVPYTLVDAGATGIPAVATVVDALMTISSRSEWCVLSPPTVITEAIAPGFHGDWSICANADPLDEGIADTLVFPVTQ